MFVGVNMNIDFSYLGPPAIPSSFSHSVSFSLCCVLSALSLLVIEYIFTLFRILLLLIAMRSVAFLLFSLVYCRRRREGEERKHNTLLLLLLFSARSTPFYGVPSLCLCSSLPMPLSVQKGATAPETAFVLSTSVLLLCCCCGSVALPGPLNKCAS